jgi:tRNA (guanosine-2'-O-)-methyltransferase
MRGFFGIGVVGSKSEVNVGTLWRSAHALGAAYVYTAGRRWPAQASDTVKTWRHLPYLEFGSVDDLFDHIPRGAVPVAIETGADLDLRSFTHPQQACYLLGAEDHGLPRRVLERCPVRISIPSTACLNVAVAGSIVMYDRLAKGARLQAVAA